MMGTKHRSLDVEAAQNQARANAQRILASGQDLRTLLSAEEYRAYRWHAGEMGWPEVNALADVLCRRQLAV